MAANENQNPIEQFQARYRELEFHFNSWLSKQSIAVEAAVNTATGALQGAAIGALMGTLTADPSPGAAAPPGANLSPIAMASLNQAQALSGGSLIQARNFAVMTGVNAGISSVMKRVRGKEDVQSCMVSAFGSGAAFSLVSGMAGPNQVVNAISSGLLFAVFQGTFFHFGQKFSRSPAEDPRYLKTKSMLSNLGLQNYMKNFKRGLLTDNTLPLLNDSALKDVRIPPGPRLLILEHVEREARLQGKKGK